MANSPLVDIYFVIIAALKTFVTKEVDLIELAFDKLQAEGLVPALGEHVKGNLTTYRESQAVVFELLLQSLDEGFTDPTFLVILFKIIPLVTSAVSPDRTYIDHTVAVLDKGATFDRNIKVGDIVEAEVHQLLEFILP